MLRCERLSEVSIDVEKVDKSLPDCESGVREELVDKREEGLCLPGVRPWKLGVVREISVLPFRGRKRDPLATMVEFEVFAAMKHMGCFDF